ncbi:unnamed protein product [Effrenium voratum]|nr:unnamed protein product [Effrenium voratum]
MGLSELCKPDGAATTLQLHVAQVQVSNAQSMGLVPVEPEGVPEEQPSGDPGKKDPMSELLHWAIENSDPETLKSLMEKYKENNLTIKDVYGQDVVDALFKNEGDVISDQIAVIQDFRNASLADSTLNAALEELEEVLHQVDHAGNLNRMGGMQPLLDLALGTERSEATRSLALLALGAAVNNNAPVQKELYDLQGLERLAAELQKCDGSSVGGPYCAKLLFCLSGLLQNAAVLQAQADQLGVTDWMMDVGVKHPAPAVVKKALGYLDTVLAQSPQLPFLDRLPGKRDVVTASLLGLVKDPDVDLSEKALEVLGRFAELRPKLLLGSREEIIAAARQAQHSCELQGIDKDVCSGLLHSAAEVDRKLAGWSGSDVEL